MKRRDIGFSSAWMVGGKILTISSESFRLGVE